MRRRVPPSDDPGAFRVGGRPAVLHVEPGEAFEVDCEDAFSGRVTTPADAPRDLAPFPRVNPLTGPVHVAGARPGDVVAVHVADVLPLRDWGVSTMSPDFGALSGTHAAPNLQPPTGERVWRWEVTPDGASVVTPTRSGPPLVVPLRPFLGTLAVAPAHGEVRTSVVPGAFGGNLDSPLVAAGATLLLRVNEAGALLHVGDGHLAQGDGEFCGTAVEGAVRTTLVTEVLADDGLSDWPRLETDEELVAFGVGRPLDDALRVALHSLVSWVSGTSGLDVVDAYQLVSQTCTARVGNLVNPGFTATVSVPRAVVPGGGGRTAHHRLRSLARAAH